MEKGFYPENLPPVFAVRNFHSASQKLGLLDTDQIERNKPLSLSRYNDTKRGGQRRIFSIANPLFSLDAASYLGIYRGQLNKLYKRSNISCSHPNFEPNGNRAISISSFSEFTEYRRKKLSKCIYIVKTDILRFFPSVYTHSIPWAVHGKTASKLDRKLNSQNIYTNKLDYIIRQAQDQQTIGLPIGPDTSRIISELITSAIDEKFLSQVGDSAVAARLVDDVYIGATTREAAENYLSAYRDAVRRFELDLNESKTAIFEARLDLEPFWPVSVRREIEKFAASAFPSSNLKSEFFSYCDEIIRIANHENDDGIIRFAIRKMDDFRLWRRFWNQAEPFLIRSAVNFPHCIDYVARVVSWHYRIFGGNTKDWESICNNIISYHGKLGNDSEVTWACWLLKEIDGKLETRACETVVNRCGPLSVLLVVDLISNGIVKGRVPKKLIMDRLDASPILSSDWLLSYEAERSFGYRLKAKNRNDYSVIGDLIDNDAQFYISDNLPFVFQGVEDIGDVGEAIEDTIGLYEDEEMPDDDGLPDIEDFF